MLVTILKNFPLHMICQGTESMATLESDLRAELEQMDQVGTVPYGGSQHLKWEIYGKSMG